MRPKDYLSLANQAFTAWRADNASSMGAALSYYTLFSIAPLLLIVISVAGLAFGEAAARGEIMAQLQGLMGDEGARAVEALLKSVNKPTQGIIATVAGVVALLIGATGVFAELQTDLDRIWRAPERKESGVWSLISQRLLSFGLVLGFAFLLIVSLIVSALLAALGKWWAPMFGAWEAVAHIANLLVSFGLMTVLFAMIYKIMPRVRIGWRDVWIGAAVTAFLFSIGKFLIGLYLGKSGATSPFGAAGSLVLVMLWVYYSAQIFLLGAEFTWVYAHAYGSKQHESLAAERAGTPVVRTAIKADEVRGHAASAVKAARSSPASRPWVSMAAAAGAGLLVAALTSRRRRLS